MQFAWAHRLGLDKELQTVDGRRVQVLHPGTLNRDAGPDFFNASVKIDGQAWVGNVEMHQRASDWYRHGHDGDRAYDSVVLHVVEVDDRPVLRPDGQVIPQVVMHYGADAPGRCNALVAQAPVALPCAPTISSMQEIYVTDWLTALAMERLFRRSEHIRGIHESCGGDWGQTAFIALARGLGFGLNSEPMEIMARHVPFLPLYKQREETLQLEAMLFGVAGLIPDLTIEEHPYVEALRREFRFLANKYGLKPLRLEWKLARTRPWNFPHRRLALLAQLVHQGFDFAARLDDELGIEELREQFTAKLQGFWGSHFTFTSAGGTKYENALTEASTNTLLINVAIPLRHARALSRGDLEGLDRAGELLQQLPPEENSLIKLFTQGGIKCRDAFTSQALIELRREYCEKRKCIYCRFGLRMLSREISR